MDINDLKHDEFLVESDVREFSGSHVTRFNLLIEALKSEKDHPVLIPVRAHANALKNPKREINLIANQIQELKQDFVDNVTTISDAELKIIRSRLIHCIDRLNRISSSPNYKNLAVEWLEAGRKLFELVSTFDKESASLADSLASINNMEQMKIPLMIVDPFENLSESDGLDSQKQSVTEIGLPILSKRTQEIIPTKETSLPGPSIDRLNIAGNSPQ